MAKKVADKIIKATDNFIDAADSGIMAVINRAREHFIKMKKAAEQPIAKTDDKWANTAKGAKKFAKTGWHIGAGVADIGGVILLKVSQLFVAGTKGLLLDNKILDFMEKKYAGQKVKKNKKGEDKKLSKFTKNNPGVAAYLTWYLMLVSVIGGTGIVTNKDKIRDWAEKKFEKIDDSFGNNEEEKYESGTYGAYFDKMKTITPFLIADLIAKEGVHVNNAGLHTPYLDSTGHWTIGFGSTMLKDGTRVTSTTPPITTEEAYELARWHLEEGETYFGMYCYDVTFDDVDINNVAEAFAIGSIMYNSFANLIENPDDKNCRERFTTLRKLYKEQGRALTDEQVLEVFSKYPVVSMRKFGEAWLTGEKPRVVADKLGNYLAGGRGLIWRRWLEAGLFTGDITPQMLLDCPMGGLYEFFERNGGNKDAFFTEGEERQVKRETYKEFKAEGEERHVKRETYKEFKEWLKNPVDKNGHSLASKKKVRDYMPLFALEACDGKECRLGDKASKKQRVQQKTVEHDTYVIDYDTQYDLIMQEYSAGNYEGAATLLETLLVAYPDNALLHNDLALIYNHLGRYDDAIAHAREVVKRIGDKSQYGAAQYNAGYAYEQKGDLESALKNYKLAVANGNKKAQVCVTRVQNALNKQTGKAKRTAFNAASGSVQIKMQQKTTPVPRVIRGSGRRA